QSPGNSSVIMAEPDFRPEPPLKQPARPQRKPFSTALSWQFNPAFKWDGRFAQDWKIPEDVDWSLQYGLQSTKLSGSTALTVALYDALFKADASLSASASYQRRPTQDSEVSETIASAWKTQDAQARYDLVSGSLRLTSSPLQDFWLLAPSSLSWSLGAALYNYKFDQLQDDGTALYTTELVEWTKERIKEHNLRASLVLRPLNLSQTIAVTATLPPLLESYSWSVSSQLPYVNLSGQTRIFRPAEAEAFTWAPLSATLVLGASPWPVLTTSYTHDLEENRVTALAHRLSWNNMSANLQFAYTSAYSLSTSGWTALEEKFQPSLLSLAWNQKFSPDAFWYNRIKLGFGVSLEARQNLLRFVESTLSFSLDFKIQVHEFIDITFSSESQNAALWRYYRNLFELSDDFAGLEPVNPITDILNGFRFFDEDDSLRRSSLFKLKSLSVKVVHYMSDWNLSFELSSAPYLNRDTLDYEFRNSWSVFLAWKAVPEIKTEFKKADDVYTW
ncbi:MAG: hypothetical protein KKC64_02695, partial [Spirochaetes bacterium]|nr:hypothetical protein [Spirochaetota bacterium]